MIQTRVARILSPTQVILAAGSEHGVEEGMEFVIYDLGPPVFDPQTGESLGELELVKGRVRATHIQDKMTVATTLAREVTVSGMLELMGSRTQTIYEKLPVEESAVLVQNDLKVRLGDLVRSVH